jgi:NAD-dependent dihydropyrimidine dehydrogenase PreA subunit
MLRSQGVKGVVTPTVGERIPEGVDGFVARTIPVRASVEPREFVLSQPEMEGLLARARQIAVTSCGCRRERRACDRPLDVCLVLDDVADEDVGRGKARPIRLSEALDFLRQSHAAGLVHLAYRFREDPVSIVCSCCPCCCWFLTRLRERGYHAGVVESDLIARFDGSQCSGCGRCVERCPFEAWSAGGGGTTFDATRCFGCGLCVSTCPSGAIRLEARSVNR